MDIDVTKVITIADKDARIAIIYLARIKSAIYFTRKHRNLVTNDVFEWCSDLCTAMELGNVQPVMLNIGEKKLCTYISIVWCGKMCLYKK